VLLADVDEDADDCDGDGDRARKPNAGAVIFVVEVAENEDDGNDSDGRNPCGIALLLVGVDDRDGGGIVLRSAYRILAEEAGNEELLRRRSSVADS
jgi:hypothetical protein